MTKEFPNNQRQGGFTLIELLIVITIIAVFANMALPSLNSSKVRSEMKTAQADLAQLLRNAKNVARSNNTFVTVSMIANSNIVTISAADGSLLKNDGSQKQIELPVSVQVSTDASYQFTPMGTVNTTGTITLFSTLDNSQTKLINIENIMGQLSVG